MAGNTYFAEWAKCSSPHVLDKRLLKPDHMLERWQAVRVTQHMTMLLGKLLENASISPYLTLEHQWI